jgi:hypothetical protein
VLSPPSRERDGSVMRRFEKLHSPLLAEFRKAVGFALDDLEDLTLLLNRLE